MTTDPSIVSNAEIACAPAPYPPPKAEPKPADAGADYFVMPALEKIWRIGHFSEAFNDSNTPSSLSNREAEGTTVITYQFVDEKTGATTPAAAMIEAVRKGMDLWENHANVLFVSHPPDTSVSADIRISFGSPVNSSWSVVGATKRKGGEGDDIIPAGQPTLNLGWLAAALAQPKRSEPDPTVLHELGHVLGMMHEHQSPARGQKITLDEDEVFKYYRRFFGFNDQLVRTQIINQYKKDESNFSEFDEKSIMMYFMPASVNYERRAVPPNTKLSELDKAYIQLAYPHNNSGKLLAAMSTIGVPESDAMKIIEPIVKYAKERGSASPIELKTSLQDVRKAFFAYNKLNIEAHALLQAKKKMIAVQEPVKQFTLWTPPNELLSGRPFGSQPRLVPVL